MVKREELAWQQFIWGGTFCVIRASGECLHTGILSRRGACMVLTEYVVLWKVNWALLCRMAAPGSAAKLLCREQPPEDFVLLPSSSLAFSSSHMLIYKKVNLRKQDSTSKSNYVVWLSSFGRERWGVLYSFISFPCKVTQLAARKGCQSSE